MTHRLHVLIAGRVQGVGFRYATARRAQELGLNGWVRNLVDSRVEAVFEGPREILEEMLVWCQAGPRFASVRSVEPDWETGDAQYDGFRLRM